MKFSELFNVKRNRNDDWFDPILEYDTKLFIDPFIIYKKGSGIFQGAHKKIINFFNESLKVVAKADTDTKNLFYKKSKSILVFPEVEELCLGYTVAGTSGAGSGLEFAEIMIEAIKTALARGVQNIQHLEELEILNTGIGADRISDITANILKKELIAYTQNICKKYSIPTAQIKIRNSDFDFNNQRWLSESINLPINPKNSKAILLVPQNFLDELPEINSSNFWDYLCNYENKRLRNDFNFDISQKVDKKTIVEIARNHPDLLKKYIDREESHGKATPYNFKQDYKNLIKWHDRGQIFVNNNPIQLKSPNTNSEFDEVIKKITNAYKNFVENQGGNELLWNDNGTKRNESAAQRAFAGIAIPYCQINNIDVSKEANFGRGPVDFKFSTGYHARKLIEVKKASTASRLIEKIKNQLPTYLKAEDVKKGTYLIIKYSRNDEKIIDKIKKEINNLNKNSNFDIDYQVVSAEKFPSASRL